MTEDKKDPFGIRDWSPPWLDNGAALNDIIQTARRIDNPLSWQIVCSLIKNQMEVDLRIASEINYMFNPDVNEEALPYVWEADMRMKNLGTFWNSLPSEYDEDDEDV